MEVLETVIRHRDYSVETIKVHLATASDEYGDVSKQELYLRQIADAVSTLGIDFTWDMDDPNIHARHIKLDDGWDILLDRGLDIWQHFDANNAFAIESRMQEARQVKQFEVTYLRDGR